MWESRIDALHPVLFVGRAHIQWHPYVVTESMDRGATLLESLEHRQQAQTFSTGKRCGPQAKKTFSVGTCNAGSPPGGCFRGSLRMN